MKVYVVHHYSTIKPSSVLAYFGNNIDEATATADAVAGLNPIEVKRDYTLKTIKSNDGSFTEIYEKEVAPL